MILSRRPDLPLTPYVECIWHYECAAPLQCRERVLPDGRFHLMLNLGAGVAAVAGLRSHHIVIDTARVSSVMGVVFRPGAARAFLAAQQSISAIKRFNSILSGDGRQRINCLTGCERLGRQQYGCASWRTRWLTG